MYCPSFVDTVIHVKLHVYGYIVQHDIYFIWTVLFYTPLCVQVKVKRSSTVFLAYTSQAFITLAVAPDQTLLCIMYCAITATFGRFFFLYFLPTTNICISTITDVDVVKCKNKLQCVYFVITGIPIRSPSCVHSYAVVCDSSQSDQWCILFVCRCCFCLVGWFFL